MPDISIQCLDCGNHFTFDEGEQEFFRQRGFTNPKRCKDCRARNKEKREKKGEKEAGRERARA
jgi:hypothetical protein